MMNVKEISHAIPMIIDKKGKVRVLLCSKFFGKRKLIQPVGGSLEKKEDFFEAALREWGEEVDTILHGDIVNKFLAPEYHMGAVRGRSDVGNVDLLIHYFAARFHKVFSVFRQKDSEIFDPKWYTLEEVFSNKEMGTLTRLMVASFMAKNYFNSEAIVYLQSRLNDPLHSPCDVIRQQIIEILGEVEKNINTEISMNLVPKDVGMIAWLRRERFITGKKLPKIVIFKGGIPIRVEY